jgi:hypothetical protein
MNSAKPTRIAIDCGSQRAQRSLNNRGEAMGRSICALASRVLDLARQEDGAVFEDDPKTS